MRGHGWKTVLGLTLTVLLLWWVLRDVSLHEVWIRVRDADPWLLLGAVLLATFSFVLRAWRWRILLEPSHPHSRFEPRFGAGVANAGIGRAGRHVRCTFPRA